jgi:uncharacterized protein
MASGQSRRSFLKTASGLAALSAAAVAVRPFGALAAGPPQAATPELREFDYKDVRLTGGPLKEQYDHLHAHYLGLDNDRLLKGYRQHAGLHAPGKDMGGWYDPDGFVPGHSLGQYISGLARIGRCTGDPACHQKARELVQGFGTVFEANTNPFAGPNSEKVWPAYVMDKHIIGLLDAYQLSGFEPARALLPKVIGGALPFVSAVSRDRIGKKDPPYDETYVLPENLFTVHRVTGEQRFRELAVRYLLDKEYFDPLAAGEDVLPSKHAYSHAIALSSAAKAYFELGDPKYRAAIVNAWHFLDGQRYASGGFGPDEQFVTPGRGALFDSLARTKDHFETPCGSYASMKLARYLLRATGDARYGDGLERVVYNALLAVKQPDSDGGYPYYSTYGVHAVKEYYPHKWPCCSGTLIQGVADYVLNVYFQTSNAVYVNLFVPSEVTWTYRGSSVKLVQETSYPAGDVTAIAVQTAAPTPFSLGMRIPGWLGASPEIRVNGVRQHVAAQPGTFTLLTRTWKNGDRVEMHVPQSFRTEAIDESHPKTVALLRGPVLYAGLDSTGLDSAATVAAAPAAPPTLTPGSLAPVGGTNDVYVQSVNEQRTVFVPFYRVQNESYNLYLQQT